MSERVLLLAPSRGLGGGIERYLSAIETVFQQEEVRYSRLDLRTRDYSYGVYRKLRFISEVRRALRSSDDPVRLVIGHPNLLPLVHVVRGFPNFAGATVLLYGSDIWRRRVRGRRTMRQPDLRVVTISYFSAGALVAICQASVLHPGISPEWFNALVEASTRVQRATGEFNVVTAFRLEDWRDKGVETILEAVQMIGHDRVRLTVCGSGPVPSELHARLAPHPWCSIAADLTDKALAEHLAAADVFVLATRTRFGVAACGEGFGIVLVEAQLAGTPVIAPAYGGGGDAFQIGTTGIAPIDESPEALALVLGRLLNDENYRAEMGRAAADWSRARFAPAAYARNVVDTILVNGFSR